ncbi:hypothetical protein CBR_g29526 [Chara braunii]|uniref:Nodulin-like domain-containing protein n=1 Tax=Chara braunii TaxID=69332 RepID=A0A388LAM9_CHABU|nr:hypothetical protein CBR_g29526 [Chara braunii]|eukprot:GBG79377.1 hypothetical protein CBR_g29526 [Chara braunii]
MVGETWRNRLRGEKGSVDDNGNHDQRGGGDGDGDAIAVGADGALRVAGHRYGYGDGYNYHDDSVKDYYYDINDGGDHCGHGGNGGDGGDGGDAIPGRGDQDVKGYLGTNTLMSRRERPAMESMDLGSASTSTGDFFRRLWGTAAVASEMLQNRWTLLVAVFWLEVFAGIQYAFPLLSPGIKRSLMYDQEEIDVMAAAKDFSCSFKFVAALLMNYLSTPLVLVIGASFNVIGFLSLWLAVRHKIEIGYWMLTSAVVIGHQANAMVDVVAMVACVTHFPVRRGVAIGLSKCILGLSAAMVTQIYRSFFDPNVELFLLVLATVPTLIMLLESPLFRAFTKPDVEDAATAEARFRFVDAAVLALVFYLLMITFTEEYWITTKFAKYASTGVMLIIFCLPLLAPLVHGKSSPSDASEDNEVFHKQKAHQVGGEGAGEEHDISVVAHCHHNTLNSPLLPEGSEEEEDVKLPDMTPLESLCSLSFWLLLLSAGIGIGSGVVVINNLSQLVEALGGKSADTDVSLISTANGLGRIITGIASETLLHKYGLPRSTCLCVATAGQTLALLLAAFCNFRFCLQNIVKSTRSFPFGTYAMAYVTGMWYDYQARAQEHDMGSAHLMASASELVCRGSQCFRGAFLICFAMSSFGLACSILLAYRTRGVYRNVIIHQRRAMREGLR